MMEASPSSKSGLSSLSLGRRTAEKPRVKPIDRLDTKQTRETRYFGGKKLNHLIRTLLTSTFNI